MKVNTLYFGFVSLLLVFLYYCHGDAYLIIWQGIRSEFFFPVVVLLVFPILQKYGVINRILKNQLLIYFLLLAGVMLIWTLISLIPPLEMTTNFEFVKKQILNLLILLVCITWFSSDANIRLTKKYLLWGLLLGVLLNYYDATHISPYELMDNPMARSTFSMIYARAAGFYLDPNVSAITLTFGLILTETSVKNKRWNLLLVLAVGLAVLLTLSISGALAFGVFVYRKYFMGKLKLGAVIVILVSFFILSYAVREMMQRKIIEFGPGITQRIMAVVDPFGSEDEIVTKNSRAILLKNAVAKFWEHPIVGNGIGQHQFIETEQSKETRAGTHAGPHNQWLAFAIDYGVLGIFFYLVLFLLLYPSANSIYRKEVLSFVVVYFIYSLFSHTALINHSLMFLLPLVYIMGRSPKPQTKDG